MSQDEQEPRVASLHALMRDIGALRRQIETDLTLTAAALEHAELEVADDLLAGSLRHLDGFDRSAQLTLGAREPWPVPVTYLASTRRARLGLREAAVAATVAAAAAVAVLVLPGSSTDRPELLQALPADEAAVVADPRVADQEVAPEDPFAATTFDLITLTAEPTPQPAAIKLASEQLAAKVTTLPASRMANDATTVGQALTALSLERQLLTAHADETTLSGLLTRNKQLTLTLTKVLNTLTGAVPGLLAPSPTATPTLPPTGSVLPR